MTEREFAQQEIARLTVLMMDDRTNAHFKDMLRHVMRIWVAELDSIDETALQALVGGRHLNHKTFTD